MPPLPAELPPDVAQHLDAAGLDPAYVVGVARAALLEDLGGPGGVDVTSTATIPASQLAAGDVVARADGVVAGLPVAETVLAVVPGVVGGDAPKAVLHTADGDRVARGDVLATVSGPTRSLLTAERTMLNLLCHLSGVATATRRWADALEGTKATVLDTRKTTPGLRALEKYAVRCGGGTNKRMGLYDVAMIKDNHVVAAGGIRAAYEAVRRSFPQVDVQVEVTDVDEAHEAVDAGARFLLCDNMTPSVLRSVVEAVGDRAELEATGGLTLDVARAYAETGVDYLSVGGLTHSAPILDIAFDLRASEG